MFVDLFVFSSRRRHTRCALVAGSDVCSSDLPAGACRMSRSVVLPPMMQAAKASFKKLVKAFGGQEAVAEETGYRQQRISDMGLPNVAEFPTLDLINMLEEIGRAHV